jgi:hypothetical protein
MSSPWYFIALWAGSGKILWKVKALLWNHLWYGSKNTARAQTSWDDYTLLKKVGGLSLTSLEDAMRALMSKWIIQALILGQ